MIRFGTLGTANITPRALVYPCVDEPRAMISVIAARSRERAEGFANYHHIRHVVDDYSAVVNHESVNAVYIPLPITLHHEWAIKALQTGKHVLCEKSFASNASEAMAMATVAGETGLVLMDAFHYRYHPIFIRAKQIYSSGVLGAIREISAAFHIPVPPGTDDIRMQYETGGGVTMDIGCYPISWVRHITGEEPVDVEANAEVGPPEVDLYLATEMTFPGGIRVTTSGDMRASATFKADIRVIGELGSMTVNNPLVPQIGNSIEVEINGETSLETFDRRATYGYQLDAFINAVEQGYSIFTGPEDAVNQMKVIDRCYESAGLKLRGLS
jgi:predicted dehydrogenase